MKHIAIAFLMLLHANAAKTTDARAPAQDVLKNGAFGCYHTSNDEPSDVGFSVAQYCQTKLPFSVSTVPGRANYMVCCTGRN